jgi:hypothetical protein
MWIFFFFFFFNNGNDDNYINFNTDKTKDKKIARREAGGGAVGAALAVHRLPVDRQT